MPLSTIFQLYWWMKPEYLEKTPDLRITIVDPVVRTVIMDSLQITVNKKLIVESVRIYWLFDLCEMSCRCSLRRSHKKGLTVSPF
jgi:hypothetical protein